MLSSAVRAEGSASSKLQLQLAGKAAHSPFTFTFHGVMEIRGGKCCNNPLTCNFTVTQSFPPSYIWTMRSLLLPQRESHLFRSWFGCLVRGFGLSGEKELVWDGSSAHPAGMWQWGKPWARVGPPGAGGGDKSSCCLSPPLQQGRRGWQLSQEQCPVPARHQELLNWAVLTRLSLSSLGFIIRNLMYWMLSHVL